MPSTPTILIVGPTAGGKTELSMALAHAVPGGGECLCADSMQVYRGMDIGTAKPTEDQRAAAPHHLLDLVDPTDDFNVDQWLRLADAAVEDVRRRGRVPIVVGGTNLYVQAFLFGLGDAPGPDPDLRATLQQQDLAELRRWLERVDPAAAAQIHHRDRKRTIRAIEVWSSSGRPFSEQLAPWSASAVRPGVLMIGLEYSPEVINRRINARVKAMIAAGLVDEVRRLAAGGRLGPQASEALGYKQIIEVLAGRAALDDAVEQIKIRTRRFAKQQRTWLRRFRAIPGSTWLAADESTPELLVKESLTAIEHWVAAGHSNRPDRSTAAIDEEKMP